MKLVAQALPASLGRFTVSEDQLWLQKVRSTYSYSTNHDSGDVVKERSAEVGGLPNATQERTRGKADMIERCQRVIKRPRSPALR
jgi:hypothetical protein